MIFVDQSEYLNKVLAYFNIVTNLTCTLLPLGYVFKPNDKQYNPSLYQKYQQLVRSLIYLIISSYLDIGFSIVKLAQQMANPLNDLAMSLLWYILIQIRYKILNLVNL